MRRTALRSAISAIIAALGVSMLAAPASAAEWNYGYAYCAGLNSQIAISSDTTGSTYHRLTTMEGTLISWYTGVKTSSTPRSATFTRRYEARNVNVTAPQIMMARTYCT